MKQCLTAILLLASLITLVACDKPTTTQETTLSTTVATEVTVSTTTAPTASTTERMLTSATETTTACLTVVTTAPINPKVTVIDAQGRKTTPYSELIWCTDIVVNQDGWTSQLQGDGKLMFQSVSSVLPQIADQIPTVTLDGILQIHIEARDGVTFSPVVTVDTYREDFTLIAKGIDLNALTLPQEPTYLFFRIHFTDTAATYEKTYAYGYFVRT